MKNYLALSVLVSSLGLFACDSAKENRVIFIPEESRAVYLNSDVLPKSTPLKEIEIKDMGDISQIYWKAPLSLSGKKISIGTYIFEVAEVKTMDVKFKKNQIVISDDECFSYSKIKKTSVKFHLPTKINTNDLKKIYFYKITSPLDDKASLIRNDSLRRSCFFITNLKLYDIDPEIIFPQFKEDSTKTTLYVINREFWYAPLDGALPRPHRLSDNWVNVSKISKNAFEEGIMLSLGNLYYLGN